MKNILIIITILLSIKVYAQVLPTLDFNLLTESEAIEYAERNETKFSDLKSQVEDRRNDLDRANINGFPQSVIDLVKAGHVIAFAGIEGRVNDYFSIRIESRNNAHSQVYNFDESNLTTPSGSSYTGTLEIRLTQDEEYFEALVNHDIPGGENPKIEIYSGEEGEDGTLLYGPFDIQDGDILLFDFDTCLALGSSNGYAVIKTDTNPGGDIRANITTQEPYLTLSQNESTFSKFFDASLLVPSESTSYTGTLTIVQDNNNTYNRAFIQHNIPEDENPQISFYKGDSGQNGNEVLTWQDCPDNTIVVFNSTYKYELTRNNGYALIKTDSNPTGEFRSDFQTQFKTDFTFDENLLVPPGTTSYTGSLEVYQDRDNNYKYLIVFHNIPSSENPQIEIYTGSSGQNGILISEPRSIKNKEFVFLDNIQSNFKTDNIYVVIKTDSNPTGEFRIDIQTQ